MLPVNTGLDRPPQSQSRAPVLTTAPTAPALVAPPLPRHKQGVLASTCRLSCLGELTRIITAVTAPSSIALYLTLRDCSPPACFQQVSRRQASRPSSTYTLQAAGSQAVRLSHRSHPNPRQPGHLSLSAGAPALTTSQASAAGLSGSFTSSNPHHRHAQHRMALARPDLQHPAEADRLCASVTPRMRMQHDRRLGAGASTGGVEIGDLLLICCSWISKPLMRLWRHVTVTRLGNPP